MSTYDRLESIAEDNVYGIGVGKLSTEYCCNIFKRFLHGDSILELGPADGIMTEIIFPQWAGQYAAIDGAQVYVDRLKNKFPEMDVQCSFFENYHPKQKYDNII